MTNLNETPILPSEPEIERILLGAILLNQNPAQVETARRRLQPSDFTVPSHREIFAALGEMFARRDSINPVMLATRLRAKGSGVTLADIAMLTDGVPWRSDLTAEIRVLQECATRREIIRCASAWYTEAQTRDGEVLDLARTIARRASEFGRGNAEPAKPLALSWGELCLMKIERGETILHEVERGETVMCPAITNRGKTTFWRNAALSMACGRPFPPVVAKDKPRSVLYLDFETPLWQAKADIDVMLGSLAQPERETIARNFHLICDAEVDERPLTLGNLRHLELVEDAAVGCKADIIVIDTLTAGFEIENENDNGEAARIMKKLTGLARRLKCVVVSLHHIGKAKQEEGQTMHAVHRGRGGSAYSGFARAIFNLLADPVLLDRMTLECAKVKGRRFDDTVFTLDTDSRWFVSNGAAVKAPSPYEQVVGVFDGEPLKRSAIRELLPDFNARTLDRYLKDAVDAGDLMETARGIYQKPESRQSRQAYRDVHSVYSPEPDTDSLDFADSPAADEAKALDAIDR